MSKDDVINTINKLNQDKYDKIYQDNRVRLIKQYGDMTENYIENFFIFYRDNIIPQITAEIIEANNKKITEDIKKLLSE